jgi:hypothetical protein
VSQIWAEWAPGLAPVVTPALVVVRQSTEPRTPTNPARVSTKRAPLDEPILESLMIPFAMVVINKFSESPSEMALTEGHHPIEALVFDRPHERDVGRVVGQYGAAQFLRAGRLMRSGRTLEQYGLGE